MALVVPDGAEDIMLQYILNKSAPQNITIRLFSNDVTPAESDVVGTYTEVTGGGYSAISLTPASWGIVQGDPSVATYPQQTWTFTAAVGNVYGYYITRDTGGELMWAERSPSAPINIQTNGDEIKVTPTLRLE